MTTSDCFIAFGPLLFAASITIVVNVIMIVREIKRQRRIIASLERKAND